MDTRLDLDAIEAACMAATPGPWSITENSWDTCTVHTPQMTICMLSVLEEQGEEDIQERAINDARLIANSREWVPSLVARVKDLELVRHEQAKIMRTLSENRLGMVSELAMCVSATEAEREACAKIAESLAIPKDIAAAIRARGKSD